MKITTPEGHYLREAKRNDVDFLFACTQAWPSGAWTYKRCELEVLASLDTRPEDLTKSPPPSFPCLLLIHCLEDDTPVGFFSIAYHGADDVKATGCDVNWTATHPAHSGKGYLSVRWKALGWFLNQHLRAEIATFEVLNSSAPVAHLVQKKSYSALPVDSERTAVRFVQSDYERDSVEDLSGYALAL